MLGKWIGSRIRTIKSHGKRYLTRVYLLDSEAMDVYLHIFHRPDPDRHVHDHPWEWAASLHLLGHYDEVVAGPVDMNGNVTYTTERRKAGQFRSFYGSTFHTIKRISRFIPCVTLFCHGKRVRKWGFWVDELQKKMDWDEYLVWSGSNTVEEVEAMKRKFKEEL